MDLATDIPVAAVVAVAVAVDTQRIRGANLLAVLEVVALTAVEAVGVVQEEAVAAVAEEHSAARKVLVQPAVVYADPTGVAFVFQNSKRIFFVSIPL